MSGANLDIVGNTGDNELSSGFRLESQVNNGRQIDPELIEELAEQMSYIV